MALGAPSSGVLRMVVVDGLKPTLAGVVLGLLLAAALVRLMEALLFGVSPYDPGTFTAVAGAGRRRRARRDARAGVACHPRRPDRDPAERVDVRAERASTARRPGTRRFRALRPGTGLAAQSRMTPRLRAAWASMVGCRLDVGRRATHRRAAACRRRRSARWRSRCCSIARGSRPARSTAAPARTPRARSTAFERAKGMTIAEALRDAADPPTVSYTIAEDDADGPFAPSIPDDMMEKAKLPRLDYTSPLELLAERFHAAPELLRRLNPSATFSAGERIVVPNVIVATVNKPPAAPSAAAVTDHGLEVEVGAHRRRRRRAGRLSGAGHDRQRARPAADRRVDGHRRGAQSRVPLQPRPVLGRRPGPRQGDDPAGTERPGRRRVDRPRTSRTTASTARRNPAPSATPRRTAACGSPTGTPWPWPTWSPRAPRCVFVE